ncbi:MAG: class I SAM-dependent methyltransferase [Minisyncoccia bacterium]
MPFREAGRSFYEGYFQVRKSMKPTLSSAHRRFLKTERSFVKGIRTLDVGCNTGDVMVELQKKGCEVWGVDIDANAINFAKKYFGLRHVYAMSSSNFFRLPDLPKFDLITFFELIEHLEDPVGFVHDVVKFLKPGGRVVLSTPSRERFFATSISSDPPPAHLTRWNEVAITNLFKGTGCEFDKAIYVDQMKLLVEAFSRKLAMGLVTKTARAFKDKRINTEDATVVGGNMVTKMVHAGAYMKNYLFGGLPAGFFFLLGKITGRKNGDMIVWMRRHA